MDPVLAALRAVAEHAHECQWMCGDSCGKPCRAQRKRLRRRYLAVLRAQRVRQLGDGGRA